MGQKPQQTEGEHALCVLLVCSQLSPSSSWVRQSPMPQPRPQRVCQCWCRLCRNGKKGSFLDFRFVITELTDWQTTVCCATTLQLIFLFCPAGGTFWKAPDVSGPDPTKCRSNNLKYLLSFDIFQTHLLSYINGQVHFFFSSSFFLHLNAAVLPTWATGPGPSLQ